MIRQIFNLMKLFLKGMISLISPARKHIKTNVVKNTTSRITLIFLFIYLATIDYKSEILFNLIALALTFHLIIIMILQIKSFISNFLNELLEGLGGFNNTINPNERKIEGLKREKELREQKEIQNWRNKLKEDYKKESINHTKFSILQDILYVIIYNTLNLSIFHIITILWNLVTSDAQLITTLDPNILNLEFLPLALGKENFIKTWKARKQRNKESYIESVIKSENKNPTTNEELVLPLLNESNIKGIKNIKVATENTTLILNQIFIHYNTFPPRDDPEFEQSISILSKQQIDELLSDIMSDIGSHRMKKIVLNLESKNLRKHLIRAVFNKYEKLIKSKTERAEIMLIIKSELTKNNKNNSYITNKNITNFKSWDRKYHTSTQTIIYGDKTNWKQLLWIIFLILRIIGRLVCYVIIINNMFYISPINLSLTGPITFEDELTNALTEAQDAAQDTYHNEAELEAEYQNTEELMQDLSNATGQSVPQLTHQLISENSNLFDPDEILETSTPNPQAPNNTLESSSEMETDMEIYINSPDSDVESNNTLETGGINNLSDTENSSFADDSILDSDSDSETDPTSISEGSDDSDIEMELDIIQEMDAEDSDVDIAELFIPLIFFPNSKFSWNKILIMILLIGLRILLSFLDVSAISELSLSDTALIIDMNLVEYQIWFNTLDKPLPDLPDLIELSIFPFFFLRNPILDKIIKDILKLVYQYLINMITSILVNKANTVLLSMGLFGMLKLHKKDKGKNKEIDFKTDTESFYKIEPNESYIDPSDAESINSMDTLATYDKFLAPEVKEALDNEYDR